MRRSMNIAIRVDARLTEAIETASQNESPPSQEIQRQKWKTGSVRRRLMRIKAYTLKYTGQTSRTLITRLKKHFAAIWRGAKKSPPWHHIVFELYLKNISLIEKYLKTMLSHIDIF